MNIKTKYVFLNKIIFKSYDMNHIFTKSHYLLTIFFKNLGVYICFFQNVLTIIQMNLSTIYLLCDKNTLKI